MALFDTGDRTEPATPRKRQEAREQGQVARSHDLSTALVLLAGCMALHFLGLPALKSLGARMTAQFEALRPARLDIATAVHTMSAAALLSAQVLLPLIVLILAVGAASNFIQVGFLVTGQPISPDPARVNPLRGFERLFSFRGLFRGAFGLMKIIVVGGVLAWTLWYEVSSPRRAEAVILLTGTVGQAVAYALEVSVTMCLRAVIAILVLAILDFAFQRWMHERDLRMTKSELKEEMRRMEGDPKIKERRRRVQQQLAYQRMMREVPKSDVVVTNPTHVAVALRYVRAEMAAPRVVAKGEGTIAQRIRETAMEHGVPVVERPELARALYGSVEIGGEVPPELYKAVAELLAYVYRISGGRVAGWNGGGANGRPWPYAGAGAGRETVGGGPAGRR
jgi:flagellar biosynthetic protein FlhB